MKKAMILAAGRGQRMGELTTHCPKALLRVGEQYLIEHAIFSIKQAGINDIVINLSYHGDQIKKALGDGSQYGIKIYYSEEAERLETGGGILQALPLLGTQPFLVMSCDIITDFPLRNLPQNPDSLAHLVMVANPIYKAQGDFGLNEGRIDLHAEPKLTYANIGIFKPELFANCSPGHFRLSQVLNPAIAENKVTGEQYSGKWYNIGTPADLEEACSLMTFSNI